MLYHKHADVGIYICIYEGTTMFRGSFTSCQMVPPRQPTLWCRRWQTCLRSKGRKQCRQSTLPFRASSLLQTGQRLWSRELTRLVATGRWSGWAQSLSKGLKALLSLTTSLNAWYIQCDQCYYHSCCYYFNVFSLGLFFKTIDASGVYIFTPEYVFKTFERV